jgi:DNA mismatch repair protein MutS2
MHALDVLEFGEVRRRLAVHCETAMGQAFADGLMPSFQADSIRWRRERTVEASRALEREMVPSLHPVRDLTQAVTRAEKGGVLGGEELFHVGEALSAMRAMRKFLAGRLEVSPRLAEDGHRLPDLGPLEGKLQDALEPGGGLRDTASVLLGQIRSRKRSTSARVAETIQQLAVRYRDLLSDPIYTVRDGRYVLPLKAENRGKIRGIVHDSSASGQTIYVEPESVVQMGNLIRELDGQEREETLRVLGELSSRVGTVAKEIQEGLLATASLDLAFGIARYGHAVRGVIPEIGEGDARVEIRGGKHPLLDPETAVPLDLGLAVGQNILITGPNTGGKTVAIKCVGLFVAMAQAGMMVPALAMHLVPVSQIWADIGDEQSMEQSLSTFSGHIKNVGTALRQLKPGALVLLDEIGSGTDPAEGAALARVILAELAERGAVVLASSHYGELKAFAYEHPAFGNAAMEFDPRTFRPTYRLLVGAPGASHALKIAERYGIPTELVEQARETLGTQAQDIAHMIEELAQAQRQARKAQGEADRRLHELRDRERRAEANLREAQEIRDKALANAQDVMESALREIRLEAQRLFDELKQSPADARKREAVRQGLKELDLVGREFAREFTPKTSARDPERVEKGSAVRVEGFSQVGVVLEIGRDGQATVQLGALKMQVPLRRLRKTGEVTAAPSKTTTVRLARAMNATTEIQLIHRRAEDAAEQLSKFIDDAVLAGVHQVRIVHGKGEGVLRKVTQELLKKHADVESFRDGEPAEGGHGVTIAVLNG